MKRLTLLLLGLAFGVSATASAQGLTMQMSNGWAFTFSGNVNVFWVFTAENNSGPKNSSIRTGLLPTFATFEAKGKEAGLNLGIHFGFAPQIQNTGNCHDNFPGVVCLPVASTQAGAQIDMRQVYLTIGFKDGSQILAGRELGLFGRQSILNDMTLFGVGAFGGNVGVKADISDLQVVVNGYIGKGVGTILMFSGGQVAADGTTARPSDGGYAQLMYKVGPKTNVGASWGFSRLKADQTGDGNTAVLVNWTSTTVGVYHQWTKSLKLVFEGTREQNGNGTGAPSQVDVSGGFMLFF